MAGGCDCKLSCLSCGCRAIWIPQRAEARSLFLFNYYSIACGNVSLMFITNFRNFCQKWQSVGEEIKEVFI
ncbi:hypothetical protein DW757_02560 [Clostridium sp. AM29-11AC]|nr:hypothetical protein DW757_02560 [Clostridium sp. AM29-11AC]